VNAALVLGAGLLGLAGTPHCAAMCGAPCTAIAGRDARSALVFHAARLLSYAAAGAVAAASVGTLAAASRQLLWLMPLWTLLQAGALTFGLWLLFIGRQPAFATTVGSVWAPVRWQRGRAAAAGALWVAWPCGLLQSALLMAALSSTAWGGALAMATFALGSGTGLWLAPALWRRWVPSAREGILTRTAGGLLVATSGWALAHGLWSQVSAWCAS
jgi:sulfite exporter TauE/SafE